MRGPNGVKETMRCRKELASYKGDKSIIAESQLIVGGVSTRVVSYLPAVAGVSNRSVCPTDSLPPVPSLEYSVELGISSRSDDTKGINSQCAGSQI